LSIVKVHVDSDSRGSIRSIRTGAVDGPHSVL
jgi:hypothetical protein